MNPASSADSDRVFQKNAIASFVQIAVLVLLLYWCFRILSPFVNLTIWALIISVAIYPLHIKFTTKLGGREKLSAALLVVSGLAVMIGPAILLAESSISALRQGGHALRDGSVAIPPPDASVANWPIIGERLYAIWSDAAANFSDALNELQPQLVEFGQALVHFSGSFLLGLLMFSVAVIVAGALLVNAQAGYRTATSISSSLLGDRGKGLVDLSIATIRSVAKGVLGVAIIQALLSAVGLAAIGVPAPGIWAGAVLILAIMQLPPLLVLAPIAVWVFSVSDPVPATIFAVYATLVSLSDAILKPMFLGRGMNIPMLVILLGAIGGAASMGISGLFVGAVILAVAYEILLAWMQTDELNNPKPRPGD
ncbi:MAG: AI-2E family transporter [Gammaproteobacteria bacterium]|nr:AI-2E family transporter [Gammaproteobacteria bacterium]MDH5241184.1 AI-2E family transporter [Gammaproteobacteria bacterium]MDH5261679.1 AI-2E family transporter [Gammaproteobacteria bacterium]MDH5584335.1 AI-2E family transporter [Gammaproteobacteria bacterium]